MASRYGQYCPVSLATEVLGERWTILIILVLCDGVTRFNDMQRALPRLSASTLAQRLRSLEDANVISKRKARGADIYTYHLTDAGNDLAPIVMEMGRWGQRWARDLETEDLDPRHLVWSIHLRLNFDAMPPGRTTIQFEFNDLPSGQRFYWIVVHDRTADVCLKHPGFEPDICVVSNIQRFVDAWRGFRSLREELTSNRIKVSGTTGLVRAFPNWLLLSSVSHIRREHPGREQNLQRKYVDLPAENGTGNGG